MRSDPIVELICIGTELLTGKINRNISYIGERLNSIGLVLNSCITVPDKPEQLQKVFKDSFKKSDTVIITGGLGPTFDDITRDIVSEVLKKKLILNRELLSEIARHFIIRGIEMPEDNQKQAYLIEDARVINNKIGTAPGQIIETKFNSHNLILFLLPGPPFEMQPMFENDVLPFLKKKYETRILKSKILHIFGLTESKVNEIIKPVIETEYKLDKEDIDFTILTGKSIIDIKVSISGENELLIDEMLHNIKSELQSLLKENIFGEDSQTLESVVGQLLTKNKQTLSVAESCTGGLLSNKITNVQGSSLYFHQGTIAYSNISKIKILGVNPEILEKYGAVSVETALEMAQGIKKLTGTDIGLSITGIAGPGGATKDKPVGLIFFAIVSSKDQKVFQKQFNPDYHRTEIKEISVNCALDILRRYLIEIKS